MFRKAHAVAPPLLRVVPHPVPSPTFLGFSTKKKRSCRRDRVLPATRSTDSAAATPPSCCCSP